MRGRGRGRSSVKHGLGAEKGARALARDGIGYQLPALVRNVIGRETDIPWQRICEIVQPIEDAINRADWLSTDAGLQFDLTAESAKRRNGA